ncbi:MAG: hypothetical protein AAF467_25540 [Actinomycetota bacterium]
MAAESISALMSAMKSGHGLVSFVDGGDLANLLQKMGDVEFEAARDALVKAQTSNEPDHEIRAALVHLSSAHHAYRKVLEVKGVRAGLRDATALDHARNRDIWACLLRAACYQRVGERQHAKSCLRDASEAWDLIISAWSDSKTQSTAALNPFHILRTFVEDVKYWVSGDADADFRIEYADMVDLYAQFGISFEGARYGTHPASGEQVEIGA